MKRSLEEDRTEVSTTSEAAAIDTGAAPNEERVLPDAVRHAIDATEAASPARPAAPEGAFGNLGLAQVIDVRGEEIDVRMGSRTIVASKSATLHEAVLRTAMETGEPVLVERGEGGTVIVVGALRTKPTPGVDKTRDIRIEADRIEIHAKHELSLATSGLARIALRATGEIETYADRIVSRAEELHKIVGRMLRLN